MTKPKRALSLRPDVAAKVPETAMVMAAVRLSRGLALQMDAKGGGAMLMNASICAVQPLWYEPIYNTTKAARKATPRAVASVTA